MNKKVLLFTRFPGVGTVLERLLRPKGVELVEVTSEDEAARLLGTEQYAGVVSSMVGHTDARAGLKLLKALRIREGENNPTKTPFVLWTGSAPTVEDRVAIKQYGALLLLKDGQVREIVEIMAHLGF